MAGLWKWFLIGGIVGLVVRSFTIAMFIIILLVIIDEMEQRINKLEKDKTKKK